MKKIDPVTTEIIRNAFISIAQDMNATLIRSAYTPIIYEGVDCSVALLDEFGNVLGQSSGLPLFLANLEVCVKETAKIYGWDYFSPAGVEPTDLGVFPGIAQLEVALVRPVLCLSYLPSFGLRYGCGRFAFRGVDSGLSLSLHTSDHHFDRDRLHLVRRWRCRRSHLQCNPFQLPRHPDRSWLVRITRFSCIGTVDPR